MVVGVTAMSHFRMALGLRCDLTVAPLIMTFIRSFLRMLRLMVVALVTRVAVHTLLLSISLPNPIMRIAREG